MAYASGSSLYYELTMEQVTSHILMIRPAAFGYNTETAVNNTFQNKPDLAQAEINQQARKEFDSFV